MSFRKSSSPTTSLSQQYPLNLCLMYATTMRTMVRDELRQQAMGVLESRCDGHPVCHATSRTHEHTIAETPQQFYITVVLGSSNDALPRSMSEW